MNCSELDEFLDDAHNALVDEPAGVVVGIALLTCAAIALLAFGERIFRPASALVGGIVALFASYAMLAHVTTLQCAQLLAIASVLALLMALAIMCVLKSAIFVLGSAALGTVTHLVYDSLPETLTHPSGMFQFMGRSGYYYVAMAIAIVGGGILSYTQQQKLMRLMSSAVGGGCLVLALHLFWMEVFARPIPTLAALLVLLGATVIGAVIQDRLHRRRTARRMRREQRPRRADPVPVGVPM